MHRCPWCNGYHRRKRTRRPEFKSWTRQIAFHIALIPLGKVLIQLFSLQLCINIRTDWVIHPWWGQLVKMKKDSEFKPVKLRLKMALCHILLERRGWYIYIYIYTYIYIYIYIYIYNWQISCNSNSFVCNLYCLFTFDISFHLKTSFAAFKYGPGKNTHWRT